MHSTRNRPWTRLWPIAAAGLPVAGVVAAAVVQGRPAAEKLLTALAQPSCVLWLSLYCYVWHSWRNGPRKLAACALAIWLGYTVVGQQIVAAWMIASLERPYRTIDPLKQQPFDVVIVLGGGTATGPEGTSHLAMSGDRVMMAARMYHAGLARRIICTGDTTSDAAGSMDPADHTTRILTDVGVPSEIMIRVGGRNTSDEVYELAQVLAKFPPGTRVGLLTSAWHLPRASRLAARRGLQVEPLPADFVTPRGFVAESFVPQAGHFLLEGLAIKEFLGMALGR